MSQYFPKSNERYSGNKHLNYIYLIVQEKQIYEEQQMLTHLIDNLASNTDLASLKVEVDKTDVNKL